MEFTILRSNCSLGAKNTLPTVQFYSEGPNVFLISFWTKPSFTKKCSSSGWHRFTEVLPKLRTAAPRAASSISRLDPVGLGCTGQWDTGWEAPAALCCGVKTTGFWKTSGLPGRGNKMTQEVKFSVCTGARGGWADKAGKMYPVPCTLGLNLPQVQI